MARQLSSTAPTGTAGQHLEFWALDASGREAFIGDLTDLAMRTAEADPQQALGLLAQARELQAQTVNPFSAARTALTFMHIGAAMMASLDDTARMLAESGTIELDQAIIDRIGDPHRVPASEEESSGQSYGAGRKPRRAVGPWVRACLAERPNQWVTHAEIATWAMTEGNGSRFGLTSTETGLTGRIGAWAKGTEARDAEDIQVDAYGTHRGAAGLMMEV